MLELARREGGLLRLSKFMALCLLTSLAAVTSLGQTSVQEFRNALQDQAGFTTDDFHAIERGEIVVKLLPVKDQREVAVCGLVRTQASPDLSLKAFTMSMAQESSNSIQGIGRFSTPPVLEDLEALTLTNRDIEDLKRCSIASCKLKMSAAMIERFRTEVNWAAPDYRLQATRLFRQILLDYVRDYLTRGDQALIEYNDQARPVRLDEEQRALLGDSLYINDFAPEFAEYLKGFPKLERPDVENSINWTKIKFGLKPVTILTHIATYTRRPGGVLQALVVSKQLYANHYFDSSLAVTASINIQTSGPTPESYLLYTNRSRADALDGAFSRLRRNLVEQEAVTNLKAILLQTKLNLENGSTNAGSPPGSSQWTIAEWLFGGTRLLWWLVTLTIIIALFAFRRLKSRRNDVSLQRDR